MHRTCAFTNEDGLGCRAAPRRESTFCFLHDPETVEEAAQARRLGGLRRRRESTIGHVHVLGDLSTVEGIRRLYELVAIEALAQDRGIERLRVLISAGSASARLLDTEDFRRRLEALETVLRLRHAKAEPDEEDEGPLDGGSG